VTVLLKPEGHGFWDGAPAGGSVVGAGGAGVGDGDWARAEVAVNTSATARNSRSPGEAMDLLDAIAASCCGSMEMSVCFVFLTVCLCLNEGVSAIFIGQPRPFRTYV